MFQVIEKAQKNNGNPYELFKQVTNNYSPKQMQSLLSTAKQYGVPDEILSKIQNNDINDVKTS